MKLKMAYVCFGFDDFCNEQEIEIIFTKLLFFLVSFFYQAVLLTFKYHTVSPGDTLSEISQRYKVRLKDLRRWNNLRSNRILLDRD